LADESTDQNKSADETKKPGTLEAVFGTSFFIGARAFAKLAESIGWPGLVFVITFYFIEKHATVEQKRVIIDVYVLGRGLFDEPVPAGIGVFFLLVMVLQHGYYQRRIKVMQEEIDRLSADKRNSQSESLPGIPLAKTTKGFDFGVAKDGGNNGKEETDAGN
jgi:hypothetical protein